MFHLVSYGMSGRSQRSGIVFGASGSATDTIPPKGRCWVGENGIGECGRQQERRSSVHSSRGGRVGVHTHLQRTRCLWDILCPTRMRACRIRPSITTSTAIRVRNQSRSGWAFPVPLSEASRSTERILLPCKAVLEANESGLGARENRSGGASSSRVPSGRLGYTGRGKRGAYARVVSMMDAGMFFFTVGSPDPGLPANIPSSNNRRPLSWCVCRKGRIHLRGQPGPCPHPGGNQAARIW